MAHCCQGSLHRHSSDRSRTLLSAHYQGTADLVGECLLWGTVPPYKRVLLGTWVSFTTGMTNVPCLQTGSLASRASKKPLCEEHVL